MMDGANYFIDTYPFLVLQLNFKDSSYEIQITTIENFQLLDLISISTQSANSVFRKNTGENYSFLGLSSQRDDPSDPANSQAKKQMRIVAVSVHPQTKFATLSTVGTIQVERISLGFFVSE